LSFEVRTCSSTEELRGALEPISHYFGFSNTLEDAERFAQWLPPDRMHAAYEGGSPIGGAGALGFELSVPGGAVQAAGITVVGVKPSHRRRGTLRALMRAQLDACRERGDLAAALWASEGTIYGRFGYGLGSLSAKATLPAEHTAFARPFEPRGTVRLVELDEALQAFPPVYDAAFARHAGFISRSETWWSTRRLFDDPARRRGGPKTLALLELDGRPSAYAIYNVTQDWDGGPPRGTMTVVEAIGVTPEAVREVWRWLLDFDWTSQFVAGFLPLDHELILLLAEPSRLQLQVREGIWTRLVDVAGALSARSYEGEGDIVLDVDDPFLPANSGRYRVGAGGAARTQAAAELRLDVSALGSAYLGGFGFGDLARAGRVEELRPGAVERADALFRTARKPWPPEIF
jgi:predicted acetyltransferase